MQDKVNNGSSANVSEKSMFNLNGHVNGMPAASLTEDYMQQ